MNTVISIDKINKICFGFVNGIVLGFQVPKGKLVFAMTGVI